MKAAVFHGPRDIRFEEVPRPELNEGEALMRIRACGICGSDLHTYREGLFLQLGLPIEQGRILGHEFSGEIVEIRGEMPSVKVGGRYTTVSMGGNAEFLRITPQIASRMIPIPDDISFEEAATNEPLATSIHAVNLADPKDDQVLVIMGAGIIGLGILQCIKARCKARTIVVDLSPRRLALAEQLGADFTINASQEDAVARLKAMHGAAELSLLETAESNIDTVFDCAGATAHFKGTTVLEQAIGLVRQNGKVIVVAVFERKIELDVNVLVRKGIQLVGSWAWTPADFAQAMELISTRKIDRKPLITHRFALEDASQAYETQIQANEAVKVVLTP
jgi:2-desacetyl-2-hydroxyethyl bacteriochlorophyllide A dehydrogenase